MEERDREPRDEGTRPERPQVPKLAALAPTQAALDVTGPRPPAPDGTGPTPEAQLRLCPACQARVPVDVIFCSQCGESLAPDPLLGKIVDERYEVVRRLGAGAMGAVYEVRHLRLGKRFAMKVIHAELSQVPEFVARFEREAHSTSRLQHPNCILVTDFGHAATGELYLVMEFLEGQPLSAELDKPLPIGTALEITRQVLLGVQHAHEAGVIHRDLKPDNVVRLEKADGSWEVKVVDFGIAKLPVGSGGGKEPLTKAGVVYGTPQYMAPEQALGGDVGPQTDIYAIGAMLWRMITGRHVFEAEGHMEVLSAKLAGPPPPLDKVAPGVFSPSVQELLRRALERNPSQRLSTALEMLELVDRIRREPGGGRAGAGKAAPGVSAVARRVVTAAGNTGRSLAGVVTGWYRGEGLQGEVTWPVRARSLVTTSRGAAVLGLMVAAVTVLVLVSMALVGDDEGGPPTAGTGRGGTLPGSVTKLPVREKPGRKGTKASPPVVGRTSLERAQFLLGQGACREAGFEAQRGLAEDPRSGRGRYLLGASLICQRMYREGLSAYAGAIAVDQSLRRDPRILEDVERMLQKEKLRDLGLDFLEKHLGEAALPTLIRLASGAPKLAVRHRAVEAVTRFGASNKVDWLQSLGLDLKQLRSCEDRAQVVDQLRQLKDARAIPVLRAARDERTGWFGRHLKHYCIRKQIIATLEELQRLPGAEAYR